MLHWWSSWHRGSRWKRAIYACFKFTLTEHSSGSLDNCRREFHILEFAIEWKWIALRTNAVHLISTTHTAQCWLISFYRLRLPFAMMPSNNKRYILLVFVHPIVMVWRDLNSMAPKNQIHFWLWTNCIFFSLSLSIRSKYARGTNGAANYAIFEMIEEPTHTHTLRCCYCRF